MGANLEFYNRAEYIPGLWMDGMDVLAVYEGTRFLKQWCMGGNGPAVAEYYTYRYSGHSMSDPGTGYRTREERDQVKAERDPITNFALRLVSEGVISEADLKALEKKVVKETDVAVAEAETSPLTPLSEMGTDIFMEPSTFRAVDG
eukprot:NODE_1067_length_616_cov_97.543210_g995_i0.p1 GENE.NODE_1067_length_616_cov_97.543210_g995_i0~~NODE_1067_length_616_cov_97.543210_g995_i0.p1  ORF type:complete len:146 (+),score=28.63 NODE_1067_length_616_cov_97.543210_g995_i0:31-468(+)